jgi:hypothetical protein
MEIPVEQTLFGPIVTSDIDQNFPVGNWDLSHLSKKE